MASTMVSDRPESSTTQHKEWARSLLRETLQRRRALRMAQTCPVVLSLRPPGRHHHGANSNYVAAARVVAGARLQCPTFALNGRRPEDDALALSALPPPPSVIPAELAPVPRAAAAAAVQVDTTTTATPAPVAGLSPEIHLLELLRKRGRLSSATKASSMEAGYNVPPTAKQVRDYDSKPFMTDLVRRGDVKGLQGALKAGRGMVSFAIHRILKKKHVTKTRCRGFAGHRA